MVARPACKRTQADFTGLEATWRVILRGMYCLISPNHLLQLKSFPRKDEEVHTLTELGHKKIPCIKEWEAKGFGTGGS